MSWNVLTALDPLSSSWYLVGWYEAGEGIDTYEALAKDTNFTALELTKLFSGMALAKAFDATITDVNFTANEETMNIE